MSKSNCKTCMKYFIKLKDFFLFYTLRILEKRDEELEQHDITVSQMKTYENAKQAEISDLRVQVGKVEQMLVKERNKKIQSLLLLLTIQHVEEH